MHPVMRDEPAGTWHERDGEADAEWQALDDAAAAGARTGGPRLEAEAAFVGLVRRLGCALRIVRRSTVLALMTIMLTGFSGVANAFTTAALEAKVVGIAYVDTLTVLGDDRTQVRVHEIDAPEDGQPFGTRAKQFTAELEQLEVEARVASRRLWADPHPVPPWEWRRGRVAGGRPPASVRSTAPRWLLLVPPFVTTPSDDAALTPIEEWPIVQTFNDAEACERARLEQLSEVLRVAKATDADSKVEVTERSWLRTVTISAARCLQAP